MKHKVLLFVSIAFFLFTIQNQADAQELTPEFEMQIFFEDALGNRDTLEVGYDERASYDTLMPEFGEFPIDAPFDSVLDVRGVHSSAIYEKNAATSKRVILHTESSIYSECAVSAGDLIIIRAKYRPITITYDTAHLNSSYCRQGTLLSPTWEIFLIQHWWQAELYYCMSVADSIVDDLAFAEILEAPVVEFFFG